MSDEAGRSFAREATAPLDRRLDDRAVWAIAALLLLLHAGLAWGARELALLTAQDDGRYMILAQALRDLSYRDLYLIGAPPHAVYPPGYPAFLTVWGAVAGSGFTTLVVPTILLSTAALAVAFVAIRRVWSPSGALLCLACLAVNPFLVTRAGSVRSEPLYMLLAMLALWALARRDPRGRTVLVAGAAAIAAALTRTIGVALVVAIGVDWLLRGHVRALVGLGVASLGTVGAWLLWTALAPNQYEGVHYFADVLPGDGAGPVETLVARIAEQVPGYAVEAVQTTALPTLSGTPFDNLVWGGVVALGLAVGIVALYRRWRAAAIYLGLYAIVVVLWPYQHTRFLEPAIPLIVVTLLLGIGVAVARLRPAWAPGALLALAAAMVGGGSLESGREVAIRQSCGAFSLADPPACIQEDRASYLRALDHIARATPEDAVFFTAKPEALYLYTGRRSVLLESTLGYEPERFAERLAERGVDRVLLGSLHVNEPRVLHDLLAESCDAFAVEAYFEPRTYLLRPRADSGGGGSEAAEAAAGRADACAAMEAYEEASRARDFSTDRWHAGPRG